MIWQEWIWKSGAFCKKNISFVVFIWQTGQEKHSTMTLLIIANINQWFSERTWYSNRDLILNQIRHLQRDQPIFMLLMGQANYRPYSMALWSVWCKNGMGQAVVCGSSFLCNKIKFCSAHIVPLTFSRLFPAQSTHSKWASPVCTTLDVAQLIASRDEPYLLFAATQFHATSISNADPAAADIIT